jgi:hypothetical protein
MSKQRFFFRSAFVSTLTILALLLSGISGCQNTGQTNPAAGTATALIQNAQSTVMVLKAQAMATGLVETLNAPHPGDTPQENNTPDVPSTSPPPTSQLTPAGVTVVAVTTAADGAYIMIEFRAPAKMVRGWNQGQISVMDESTGNTYTVIPAVGDTAPLISRPQSDDQLDYVMLENAPIPLQKGAVVTVVLGHFKQEHLPIQ